MYTIKRASERTGVPVATLRAWERRYGIGSPSRSDSGYRLYDAAAIAAISAMQRLIVAGWAPRQASVDILRRQAEGTLSSAPIALIAAEPAVTADGDQTDAFIEAAKHLDEQALTHVLDEAFARGSFEFVVDRWLMPMLRQMGDEWMAGRMDIANEHFASHAIMRRLNAAFESAAQAKTGRLVLVGLPSGSYHEMGALAFATVARRRGMEAVYLGADVPPAAWTTAIGRHDSAAAVVAVMTSKDVAPARHTVESLLSTSPQLVVAIGGPHAHKVKGDALVMPPGIAAAAEALAECLGT
jgi:DNA-binding transcriptional MerR regulator/methylmalonyl-CoA mutase cobalamin-binding subunit